MSFVMVYLSNLILSCRDSKLIRCIVVFEVQVCKLVSSFSSAFVGNPVGYCGLLDFAEDVFTRGVLISMQVSMHNILKLGGLSRTMYRCTVNLFKTYLTYSRSLEVECRAEGFIGYHLDSEATEEISNGGSRCFRGRKWATSE